MKVFLAFIGIILISRTVKSQNINCIKFRDGNFKTTINGVTAFVYRKGFHQFEIGVKGKDTIKVGFSVKWLDDCTYTLVPDSEYFQKFPRIPKNAMMTVKISNVKTNSYLQTISVNFSDKIFTSEMILLPNK